MDSATKKVIDEEMDRLQKIVNSDKEHPEGWTQGCAAKNEGAYCCLDSRREGGLQPIIRQSMIRVLETAMEEVEIKDIHNFESAREMYESIDAQSNRIQSILNSVKE